jgi:hypothetical protein
MPLTCYEHDIVLLYELDCPVYGITAVGNDDVVVPAQTLTYIIDDRERVFGAWVVRRDDCDVRVFLNHPAHLWPFSTVSVTSAAEHGDDPPTLQ